MELIAPPPPSPLVPGYKLERYELICPIAEGGMASVWIALQTGKHGFQKLVAIKTILPKYAAEPAFQQMFLDEARIASRIEHGHVAQILDVGEHADVTYLVMEYVDGDSLARLNRVAQKKGQRIPPGVALRVMADVCGGLHAAHELHGADGKPLGVVHRDVSPQNVLVSTQGIAKLIDFGIAKAQGRIAGDTTTETLKGKVQYMAPEQAVGKPVDRRADVWAAGAVLYHLLAGRTPFEGENQVQTLMALSNGRPPPPLVGVHPAVAAVVHRALTHSPDGRFGSAAEMQRALEDAMVAAGLATSPTTVAAFVAEQAGDRADQRRQAIAMGLKAAEEREKLGVPVEGIAAYPTSHTGQTLGPAALAIPQQEGKRGIRVVVLSALGGAAIAAVLLLALTGRGKGSAIGGSAQGSGFVAPPAPCAIASSLAAPSASASMAPAAPDASASAAAATAPPPSSSPPPASGPARPSWRPAWTPPRAGSNSKSGADGNTRVNDGF